MKIQKKDSVPEKKKQQLQRATKKYRRIKTIVRKLAGTCTLCGIKALLYVYEPEKKKLREVYTSDDFKHSELQEFIQIYEAE